MKKQLEVLLWLIIESIIGLLPAWLEWVDSEWSIALVPLAVILGKEVVKFSKNGLYSNPEVKRDVRVSSEKLG